MSIEAFGYTLNELTEQFRLRYGKGRFHAEAFFHHLYRYCNANICDTAGFRSAQRLASEVSRDLQIVLPKAGSRITDDQTLKFTLIMADGSRSESVLIPMSQWFTLCLSSQIGCARGCVFCRTGEMGLVRNLECAEIVSQWAFARFHLNTAVRNIVFMGMGEPFDNFDQVIRAVRILSDPRGPGIPKRRIAVSTAGHAVGIRALTALENQHPDEAWRTLRLAVSIHAADNELRGRLMPINRKWPLKELKSALLEAPQAACKDALYFEYMLIAGINDTLYHAEELIAWMDGLRGKVNLIAYHPVAEDSWDSPGKEQINRFFEVIRASGRECRIRRSRGRGIAAACGMLGVCRTLQESENTLS